MIFDINQNASPYLPCSTTPEERNNDDDATDGNNQCRSTTIQAYCEITVQLFHSLIHQLVEVLPINVGKNSDTEKSESH